MPLILAGQTLTAGLLSHVRAEAPASAPLALVATQTDVPGAAVTVTAQTSSAFYVATISLRMDRSVTGSASFAVMKLDLDGVNVAGQLPVLHNVTVAETFYITKQWSGSLTAGSHIFKIRGSCATAGIWTVASGDSNIVVTVSG